MIPFGCGFSPKGFVMFKAALSALALAGLAFGAAASAQAEPTDLSRFDVHGASDWADKLVLCDVTAFLASKPDLDANRMWVRRDAGPPDLLLPPDFVQGGQWYKEGYRRLYDKMRRDKRIEGDQVIRAQDTAGRSFIDAYRRSPNLDHSFLNAQDSYCRSMARAEGEIVF